MEWRFNDTSEKPLQGDQLTLSRAGDTKDGWPFGEEMTIAYHTTANIPTEDAHNDLNFALAKEFGSITLTQTAVEFMQHLEQMNSPKRNDLEMLQKAGMNATLSQMGVVVDQVRVNKFFISDSLYRNYREAQQKLQVDAIAEELKKQ